MKDEVNSLRKENEDLVAHGEDQGHALELKKKELFLNTTNEDDDASLLGKLKVSCAFGNYQWNLRLREVESN